MKGQRGNRKLAMRVLAALVLCAALAAGSSGFSLAARGESESAASAARVCDTVKVKVHAKRWVWVKERPRVRGRRVPVIRHGKIVYVRVRVRYLKTELKRVCPALL